MFEFIVEKFRKQPYLWAAVVCALVITILTPLTRRVPPPPPALGDVPAFSMTNQEGQPFGTSQLAGKPYVASFVFTRCTSFCPLVFQHLKTLQERIQISKLPLSIVSFTVDPDFDSASVLKSHAQLLGAHPEHWTFLTAEKEAMALLVEKGFMVAMGETFMNAGMMDIAHAKKLVLIDAQGKIRGYYDASSEGIDEIFSRAEAVAGEALL